ncbi:MAG: SDR family NAD(P)-dependent oxidoreductase [Candidatus Latescibacteria bacterium]|nr:SDR family NAD(P)-dependent oxidoreductase [Candidatus Latescibacterota bacterium]
MQAGPKQVALVTGASRGVGKGIAQALGAHGMTVYITGRTTGPENATVPISGSITETAALVTQGGGTGIPIQCDHGDDTQVKAVFDRIKAEQDRLDVLVNNAWSGYQSWQGGAKTGRRTPFWKTKPALWDAMFHVGVRSHYIASVFAADMMVDQGAGLIVNISAGLKELSYNQDVPYSLSKAATNQMALFMGKELAPRGVSILSLLPNMVGTEMLVARKNWPSILNSNRGESPQFIGYCIAALAEDPEISKKNGMVFYTKELAEEYGIDDKWLERSELSQ